jgi:hypothetical protein
MTGAPAKGAADQSSTNDSGPVDVETASSPLKAAVALSLHSRRPVMPAHVVVNDCSRVSRWPNCRSANAVWRTARPVQPAAKNGRGAISASGPRVLPIIEPRIGAISTHRQEGDIRDSGCPAAVRTANFRTKPARKTTGSALANIKLCK